MEKKRLIFESLRCVCDVLRSFGIVHLTPKTFLLVKSNTPHKNLSDVNIRFWKTLHDLLLIEEFDCYEESTPLLFQKIWKDLKIQKAIRYVKFKLMSSGYINPHFYVFPQRDLYHSSIELLLTFTWILNANNILEKYLNRILANNESSKSLSSHQSIPRKSSNFSPNNLDFESLLKNLTTSVARLYFLSRSIHDEIMYSTRIKDKLQSIKEIGTIRFPSGLTLSDIPLSLKKNISLGVESSTQLRVKNFSSAIQNLDKFVIFFQYLEKFTSLRRILISSKLSSVKYKNFEKIENSLMKEYYFSSIISTSNIFHEEKEGEEEEEEEEEKLQLEDSENKNSGNLESLKHRICVLKNHLEKYLSNSPNLPISDQKKIIELKFGEFVSKYLAYFSFPKNMKIHVDSFSNYKENVERKEKINREFVEMRIENLSDQGIPSMCRKEIERIEIINSQILRNLEKERSRNSKALENVLSKLGRNFL